MDTLTKRLGAMIKADAEMVQECATLVAESAGRLYQAQLDTADKVCSETTRQYRELMSAGEPASLLSNWPKTVEANIRSATEATSAYLENAIELQSGLIRIFHDHLPVLNRHFFESVGEATRVARSVGAIEFAGSREYEDEAEPARQPA
jgi:hypothetical protein